MRGVVSLDPVYRAPRGAQCCITALAVIDRVIAVFEYRQDTAADEF
jgi:hypothetical protein